MTEAKPWLVETKHHSQYTVLFPDRDSITAGNNIRGSIPKIGVTPPYQIAANPPGTNYESIESAFVAIVRERIINDLYVLEAISKEMEKQGIIKNEFDINVVAEKIRSKIDF